MWKKLEDSDACGGDEWHVGIWGQQSPEAFSLEEPRLLRRGSSLNSHADWILHVLSPVDWVG